MFHKGRAGCLDEDGDEGPKHRVREMDRPLQNLAGGKGSSGHTQVSKSRDIWKAKPPGFAHWVWRMRREQRKPYGVSHWGRDGGVIDREGTVRGRG